MTSLKNTIALLLMALAASACVTHRDVWVPPSTPEGTMCVSNCNSLRQSCQANELFMNQTAYQQCQRGYAQEMNAYNACKAQYPSGRCTKWRDSTTTDASGRQVTKKVCEVNSFSSPCVEPKRCEQQFPTPRCEQEHRSCYQACGGRIDRVKVE